jgi:uncharacterized protein (DUF2235 family)
MPKRIALFLDGTWNTSKSNTNVWKLHKAVQSEAANGLAQISIYDPGVGTVWEERLRGGIFGYGLDRNVREAYAKIVEHYVEGDEIFLFGFSRGAFTARSLAGMIAKCGLATQAEPALLQHIWDHYVADTSRHRHEIIWARDDPPSQGHDPVTPSELELLENTRKLRIHFIGVWDTVGSLGIPFGNIPGLSRRDFRFHNTNPSKSYDYCCHAMAIDEYRRDYEATLWSDFAPVGYEKPREPPPHIEQRWFAGVHTDIGGGSGDSRVSDIALHWMAGQAEKRGLAIAGLPPLQGDEARVNINPPKITLAYALYRLVRPFKHYRPIGSGPMEKKSRAGVVGRVQPIDETIDASVFERWRHDQDYRPEPLLRWSARTGVDPANVTGSVKARTGAPLGG